MKEKTKLASELENMVIPDLSAEVAAETARIEAEKAEEAAALEAQKLQEQEFELKQQIPKIDDPWDEFPEDLSFEESGDKPDYKKPIKKTRKNFLKNAIIAFLSVVLLSAASWGVLAFINQRETPANEPVVKTESGQVTWKMVNSDYSGNRWFADGISEIQSATTQQDAVKAATVWLDRVKTDANLLVGAAKFFLNENIDKSTLVDAKGYATDAAIQLTERIGLALATSNIKVADAPENGVNSGTTADGTVIQASSAGITGDRKAIQITDKNGQSIWIMARCGNPVTTGDIGLGKGGTDNPAPPPTEDLTPKSSNPLDYPYPRGDDDTTDSGTGIKPPVDQVTTPAETTPPAVEVTTPGGGGVVDTPTAEPGTETGVTAPEVEEPPAETPVDIPVEPGADPGAGEINKPNPEPANPFE